MSGGKIGKREKEDPPQSLASKDLRDLEKEDPPQSLTSKDFTENELIIRFLTVKEISGRLFWLGICASIASVALAGLGVILVVYGDRGESALKLFGQEITTESVGVACVGAGTIALVMLVRQIVMALGQISGK